MVKKLMGLNTGLHETEELTITRTSKNDIAIIGLNAIFPMGDAAQFWEEMCKGYDHIKKIPKTRQKDIDSYMRFLTGGNVACMEAAYLQEIDKFDYSFFGLSPKEASLMDPNQRIFLETVWGAVEDAGYGGGKLTGTKTAVYVGYSNFPGSLYHQFISTVEPASAAISVPDNLPSIIASRIAYLLDLKGASMIVDTACSSSLTAVHLACQGLRNGDCDQAIVGAIKINLLPIKSGQKMGIESSTGRTKAFDDSSDGTGIGEGSMAVILKPLYKAIKDKDNIYAVIKGSAINQDGSSIGITAPNVLAQRDVIIAAWKDAGIEPETITYIEAHGTGTKLGDPIEIDGITQAFRNFTDRKQFCAVSSVKTNLGHLDNAAGMAGLIKAVFALKYGLLPPNVHFQRPNRKINFEDSPVYVNDKLRTWETGGGVRRCGVSSFGLSGTNCHVVLEEAPHTVRTEKDSDYDCHIFTLSAKDENDLKRLLERYVNFLQNHLLLDIGDICYTVNTGRWHYQYRLAMIVKDTNNLLAEILQALAGGNNNNIFYNAGTPDHYTGGYQTQTSVTGLIAEPDLKIMNEMASQAIKELHMRDGDSRARFDALRKLGELYVKGTDIDWNALYQYKDYQKVSLPIYPFKPSRCWLDIAMEASQEMDELPVSENLFYQMRWRIKERTPVKDEMNGTFLVITHKSEIGDIFCENLQRDGKKVIKAELGTSYQNNENCFVITGNIADYQKLLEEVNEKGWLRIIHLLTFDASEKASGLKELETALENGVYSLFNLVKAINNLSVAKKFEIILISGNAAKVTGEEERIQPENAALFGLGKVIGMENPQIICRCIDVDHNTSVDEIILEIESGARDFKIAFRNGGRYIEEFEKLDVYALESRKTALRETGVYLITGGTGGIGMTIAKYMASQGKVNLALLSRSRLPERREWETVINDGADLKLRNKLCLLKEIEDTGSHVECYNADVCDEKDLAAVLTDLRHKYGGINGVIHCAGIAGDGFIFGKKEEEFRQVLAPKVIGTWLLDRLTHGDELDFFIMFSSITSLFGAPGQSDYTAANSYLDAFAERTDCTCQSRRILTINWPTWKEVGMAVNYGVNVDGIFKAISSTQAMNAFDAVFNRPINRVIIGELNYDQVSSALVTEMPFNLSDEIRLFIEKRGRLGTQKRDLPKQVKEVKLTGHETDSYTEFEKLIARIWSEVLGFEALNINDNFFEIGGNSLLMTGVYSMLEESLPGQVAMVDLFVYPTISKLAQYLSDKNKEIVSDGTRRTQEEDEISKLVAAAKNGNITVEEALRFYSQLDEDK